MRREYNRKDLKGGGRGLFEDTTPGFASVRIDVTWPRFDLAIS